MLMIEDTVGIANLDDILKKVPGIGVRADRRRRPQPGAGLPAPVRASRSCSEAMAQIVATCKKHNVPVGHPHVDSKNVERVLGEGYRFLMSAPVRSYAALEKAQQIRGA